MPPRISCLMVTAAGRVHLAKKSIQCFCDQTYLNKELVVVNEGPKEYQEELQEYIANLEREDIRTVWLRGQYSLGALRNISLGISSGEYFVQWDDDDWCLPNRIATQYSYLSRNKALVCYLSDQLHYYFSTNVLYWDNWKKYCSGGVKEYSLIPGTIMAKKADFFYPAIGDHCKAGEDSVLSVDLLKRYKEKVILLQDMGFMHMYTFHGNQVYNLEHHMNISALRCQTRGFMLTHQQKILTSLEYFGLSNVRVMCQEGVAFDQSA